MREISWSGMTMLLAVMVLAVVTAVPIDGTMALPQQAEISAGQQAPDRRGDGRF